jgi:crotonobetainyl-CoA:carnitine CoA-transferase CaiB-like acyl-CoA transferase
MSLDHAYAGLRVVDLSQAVAGPYCASILARLGADVIKIEPMRGDWGRTVGTMRDGHTAVSVFANLGKRSLVVDLKTEEGAEIVRRLVMDADIFIESFRPGVTERLGFGHEAMRARNPRLIYLSLSGFGQRGPLRERPGTDGIMQAFSGFMAANKGGDGLPHGSKVIFADLSAALYNVQAIQAALWLREKTGEGRYIDNSLLQSAAAFQNVNFIGHVLDGENAAPPAYPYGTFPTADGGHVVTGVLYDREFPLFCDALELHEFKDDPRFASAALRIRHREVLDGPIRQAAKRLSTDELCRRLTAARILHERINSYADFLEHPQTAAMGALVWVEHPGLGRIPLAPLPGTEADLAAAAPRAPGRGEHGAEILRELGLSETEIDRLMEAGAVELSAPVAA